MKPDVGSRSDLEVIVSEFYSAVMTDPQIGHHFVNIHLESHLPLIVDFWEKALFAKPVYFGNPAVVHQILHERMPLNPEHFTRWVELFVLSVDGHFAGENADEIKLRARMVADSLSQQLNTELRFSGLGKRRRLF